MPNVGPIQLIIILFVILLLFGSKKLPGLARSLGQSLNEFKRGKDEIAKEIAEASKQAEIEDSDIKAPDKQEAKT